MSRFFMVQCVYYLGIGVDF